MGKIGSGLLHKSVHTSVVFLKPKTKVDSTRKRKVIFIHHVNKEEFENKKRCLLMCFVT